MLEVGEKGACGASGTRQWYVESFANSVVLYKSQRWTLYFEFKRV